MAVGVAMEAAPSKNVFLMLGSGYRGSSFNHPTRGQLLSPFHSHRFPHSALGGATSKAAYPWGCCPICLPPLSSLPSEDGLASTYTFLCYSH